MTEPHRTSLLNVKPIDPQAPFWVVVAVCVISMPIAWYKFVLPKTRQQTEIGAPVA